MARVKTIEEAAAWVDRVGLALLFGKADLVLPSLWEAVAGHGAPTSIRDAAGTYVAWSPGMEDVWTWKDELPARKLAAGGKHLARSASLVAPRLLPALVAARGDVEPVELQREIVEVVREQGPLTGPELRRLLGAEAKRVNAAVNALQHDLVLTNVRVVPQEQGWAALQVDLLERRWRSALRTVPPPEEARRILASTVLASARELSAADLAAALGWRRKAAATVLDELTGAGEATVHEEDDVRIWGTRRDWRNAG